MGFSRQEHWSGLPFPIPEDLPKPEIEPMFLMSPALAGEFFSPGSTWEELRAGLATDSTSKSFYTSHGQTLLPQEPRFL